MQPPQRHLGRIEVLSQRGSPFQNYLWKAPTSSKLIPDQTLIF